MTKGSNRNRTQYRSIYLDSLASAKPEAGGCPDKGKQQDSSLLIYLDKSSAIPEAGGCPNKGEQQDSSLLIYLDKSSAKPEAGGYPNKGKQQDSSLLIYLDKSSAKPRVNPNPTHLSLAPATCLARAAEAPPNLTTEP